MSVEIILKNGNGYVVNSKSVTEVAIDASENKFIRIEDDSYVNTDEILHIRTYKPTW